MPKMKSTCFLAVALTLLWSVSSNHVVKETLPSVPTGWIKLRDADEDQRIRLRIALDQPHLALFEQTLYNISTPGHQRYGKHLSREELASLMKPRDVSTAAVLDWLTSNGIPAADIEDAGEWINTMSTVGTAQKLLQTEFSIYRNEHTGVERLRTLRYSVPEDVASHVTMIQPTTRFGQIETQKSHVYSISAPVQDVKTSAAIPSLHVDASCNRTVTPACLRALYKIGNYKADANVSAIFGVSGFLEQYAKHDSLHHFLSKYAPYATEQNFTTILVNGGKDEQANKEADDIEANLDMQYSASLAYQTDIRYYSVGGRGPLIPDISQPNPDIVNNEPYLDFLTYLLNLTDENLPRTLTTSYGENEQSVPVEYVKKVCNLFGQLGARGVSILFSSGDSGPGSGCLTNDGTNTTRFMPTFPGACPYITSVGGTHGVNPELAVGFSSGGFSDVFPRPDYQDVAVKAYLEKLGKTYDGLYNRSGRAFPDVAAQGRAFQVITRGITVAVGGTSASAPAFAAIVSLLNNARIKAGSPPLGFLNPWLYSTAVNGGLTDIVGGRSEGCDFPGPRIPGAGWNATEGWDPVTGLGTPLFDQLLRLSAPRNYTDGTYGLARIQ